MITRRSVVLAMAGTSISPWLFAREFPSRPIKMVVGFSPGGGTDVTARIISTKLSELLGSSVVVENKTGAAGTLAASQVERAAPDGYTMLLNASGTYIHSIVHSNYAYKPLAVSTPIAAVCTTPVVLIVNKDIPVKDLEEFVKLAGQKDGHLTFGSDGVLGTAQLNGEYFCKLAGIKMLHVPFRGSGESVVAAVSGQVDAGFPTLPATLQMLKAGKVRALAVTGPRRSKILPDVPTFEELGYKDFDFLCWFGLIGPQGMPADVVKKLNNVTQQALQDPVIQKSIENQGMEAMFGNSEEWLKFMVDDAEKIKRMAIASNLKAS